MSGENRRSWLLPVIVVAVGAYILFMGKQAGTLDAAELRPVNWVGLGLMVAGVAAAFFKKPVVKLVGVLGCAVGAILVTCL